MWEIFLFFFIIVPLVHLIHELGHVLVAKLFKVSQLKIVIGKGPELFRFSFAGIKLYAHYILFLGGYSTNEQEGNLSPAKIALIALGGPFFNIMSLILFFPFLPYAPTTVFYLFFFFSCWIGFINLIPFKIGDKKSDGWQALTALFIILKSR